LPTPEGLKAELTDFEKEQQKHEFENWLKEQAAGGYNLMRRRHQKSLRQVCWVIE